MITKTKLNSDTIKNLNQEQLDELVYNKAVNLHLGTFGEKFKNTENDLLLKAIFATTVLDAEVRNGGFDQFFSNSEDLANDALIGLTNFKAYKHADLLKDAINIFNQQKEEFMGKRNPNLDFFDEQYYTFENINPLRQKFIVENIEKWLD